MKRINAAGWVKIIGAAAAAVVAIVTALAVTGAFDNDPAPQPEPKASVPQAIVVDGPDQDAKTDDIVPLTQKAREVTADLIAETGRYEAPDVQVDDGSDLRGDDTTAVAPLEPPYASEEVPGCRTRFLTTNYSSRAGVTPKWMSPHFTAGRDIPNSRADVDGLTAYGNNPASRVSWHFNLDKDGNCDYNVPIRYKAWTISNANPSSINAEVHGAGEAPYLRPAGYRQLARIWKYVHEAYPGIPLRVGSVNACVFGNSGWITHWMTGLCGGNHSDIRPFDLADVVAHVRAALRDLDCGDRCHAKRRQRKVIAARVARHDATHAAYQREGCRGRMHTTRPSELHRPACRDIKARGHRQHAAIRRAKRTLRAL